MTFGDAYICNAFRCREACRDEGFSPKRPFSTEADVKIEHGGVLTCSSFCCWTLQV